MVFVVSANVPTESADTASVQYALKLGGPVAIPRRSRYPAL